MNNFTPDPSTGQILPGSKFGDKLTELAREAKVIVEIGTWKGQGSTWCLWNGMDVPDNYLITIEADPAMWHEAKAHWHTVSRMWVLHGTIVKEMPEFYHFDQNKERRKSYLADRNAISSAPYCLPIIPAEIDLLLLDGGEWTSHLEYLKLRDRCKIIALDDTHQAKSIKNYRAREDMLHHGWTVLADEPEDRNGWFIGRRP